MTKPTSRVMTQLHCAREEWEANTTPHPKTHLIGKRLFIDEFRQFGAAIAWLEWYEESIEIKKIETLQPRSGGSTRLVQFLKALADKYRLRLWGHARTYTPDSPLPQGDLFSKEQLEAFYIKRGFRLRSIDAKTSEIWYP